MFVLAEIFARRAQNGRNLTKHLPFVTPNVTLSNTLCTDKGRSLHMSLVVAMSHCRLVCYCKYKPSDGVTSRQRTARQHAAREHVVLAFFASDAPHDNTRHGNASFWHFSLATCTRQHKHESATIVISKSFTYLPVYNIIRKIGRTSCTVK
jgi:hypothetical protein